MMPMYMNSSQQAQMRPQEHYHHPHQGFGNNNPHHMTMDAPCGYWATPSSSSPCYGSCIHGNLPASQAYWPPCYPPQVPYHHPCCMNHSGFHPYASHAPSCYSHQPFPVSYQPMYESEKDVPGKHHCAKCSPYPKSNGGVVIEEHEPEIDKGDHGKAGPSVRSGNYPYPIVWIPHENARIQEHGSGSHNQPPENMKVQKCDPRSWNGCSPFDESIMKPLTQNHQERKKMQNGKTVELPFDINKLISYLQGQDPKIQEHGSGSHNQHPADVKAPENMKLQKYDPNPWNGRFPLDESTLKSLIQNQDGKKTQKGNTMELPFDINKLISLLQGQDEKEVQNQKNKEESGQVPYPVFWKQSHGSVKDAEASESKERSNEGRNSKSLLQGQDGKEVEIQKNKEQVPQFPYPIFWIPSHGKGEDAASFESKEGSNEGHNAKSFPVFKGKEGNSEGNVLANAEEKSSMRNVPVEGSTGKVIQEPRNIPVKVLSDNHRQTQTEPPKRIAKEKPGESTKKEQSSSSSPKASRLPPVCLRVDPLPKRKNGVSKSLSPPRRKTSEESKVASLLGTKNAEPRTAPEACNVKCEEANKEMKESAESNSNLQGGNSEIVTSSDTKENREKPAKMTLTEEEAARIIQSRYRGYDVRRWEPIKKLKEIATVREQMGDVKKRVQVLEASCTDKRIEEKEMIVLEETLMNLLLKLDSVQRLHQSIREHRKSLARELSDIEEKLDSLKRSNAMTKEEAVEEQVQLTSQISDCPVNLEQSQLENNTVTESKDTEKVLPPSPEEQLAAETEGGPESSETLAVDTEAATETGNSEAVAISSIPEKIGEVESVSTINPPSDDGNGMTVTKPEEDEVVVERLEEHSQLAKEKKTVLDSKDTEKVLQDPMSVMNIEQLTAETGEGPELSEALTAMDHESATETGKPEATTVPENAAEVETVLPVDPVSADGNGVTATTSEEDRGMVDNSEDPLRELPQVFEIVTQVSEPESHASENDDRKEEDETISSSEKVVELSELPVGVIDDETPLVSQDSSPCIREAEITAIETTSEPEVETEEPQDPHETTTMESETVSQEEDTDIKTSKPLEETEKLKDSSLASTREPEKTARESETLMSEQPEVTEHEVSEETKRLMEENQRFKETVGTLVKAGREQLEVISKLTGRVKSLEKKLSQKKKKRSTQIRSRKAYREKQETKPMSNAVI